MPRRLASFLAHVRASGLSRIETAWYFAGPFGGRPRRGRLVPSFFAIGFRAASVSRAVTRRAFSKGKVFALDISLPLLSIRGPRADDPVDAPRVANREDHHEDAGVGLSDQPPSFFSRRRVNCIGCDATRAKGSSNAVMAIAKLMPCFAWFAAAFRSSHSNRTAEWL